MLHRQKSPIQDISIYSLVHRHPSVKRYLKMNVFTEHYVLGKSFSCHLVLRKNGKYDNNPTEKV